MWRLATLFRKMWKTVFCNFPKMVDFDFYFFLAVNPLTYGLLESKKKPLTKWFWIGQIVFQKIWQPCWNIYFPFSRLLLHLDWWNLGIKHVLDVEREWHWRLSFMTPHSPDRVANFLKKKQNIFFQYLMQFPNEI